MNIWEIDAEKTRRDRARFSDDTIKKGEYKTAAIWRSQNFPKPGDEKNKNPEGVLVFLVKGKNSDGQEHTSVIPWIGKGTREKMIKRKEVLKNYIKLIQDHIYVDWRTREEIPISAAQITAYWNGQDVTQDINNIIFKSCEDLNSLPKAVHKEPRESHTHY